jgi:hypothetical protein
MWAANECSEPNDVWAIFQSHEDVSGTYFFIWHLIPSIGLFLIRTRIISFFGHCQPNVFSTWEQVVQRIPLHCYLSGTRDNLFPSLAYFFLFIHFHRLSDVKYAEHGVS